jgi:hypothetical protein
MFPLDLTGIVYMHRRAFSRIIFLIVAKFPTFEFS